MNKYRMVLVSLIVTGIILFFLLDAGQYLTLEYFNDKRNSIISYYITNPFNTGLYFFILYVVITGLSLPGAGILSLVAGAIFGLLWGTIIVSFASTLGATLAFLSSRFILRDSIQKRFSSKLKTINKGIQKDGAFYLFTLRMVPVFPFFIINLVMGIMPIGVLTFMLVSQVGMLPATMVFVNAGMQIGQIQTLGDILSFELLLAFALLGIFPLLAKKIVSVFNAYRVYRNYQKPKKFNKNLVVIGAGSAGLVAAYIAAAVKASVTLIEKHKMGGECLNTGCVPSKALIRSSKFLSHVKRAKEFGFTSASADFDFATIMERVQRVINTIEPHDSVERYTRLGVECIKGEAKISSPWTIEVNDRTITTKNIVIAAGSIPFVPPIDGIDRIDYYTSDTIWGLRTLPKRLVILGGGPIGCELAQCFARFGSEVSQVEMLPRLLSREDLEFSELISKRFSQEGVRVLTGHKAKQVTQGNNRKVLVCETGGRNIEIEFDELLVAVGRKANTSGYGLEDLNISLTPQGTIEVNEYLQTVYPNIYACGDIAGPYQFTHTAAHQAWYAAVNALFGKIRRFKVDYSVIPWATFTDPEVARVGMNELEAKEKNIPYEVTIYGIDDLDRAIADEEAHGLVKVLTVPGKDRILGVTIIGEHASDLIAEFIGAMRNNIGLNKILSTIHIYPTLAEANKFAAGNWKKAHTPEKLLHWVKRYHRWMRH